MSTVKRIISIMVCTSVLLPTGCVNLWQDNLDIKTYLVEARREAAPRGEALGQKLWIEPVTVLPPYNMRNLVIRESEVEFTTSYYTELLISPSENFRNAFYSWFADSGVFRAVSLAERNGLTHRLAVTVMEFYGDIAEKAALLRIKVALIDENTKEMRVLFSNDYARRVELAEVNAEQLVLAYNRSLAAILSACEEDVIQALR